MTRGARRLRWRLAPLLLAFTVALLAAACGGSGHKQSTTKSTKSKTSTAASTTTTAPKPPVKVPVSVSESVRDLRFKTFRSRVAAKPDDVLELRTLVTGDVGKRVKPLLLTIGSGPAKRLTVTARWDGKTSSATITGAGGVPVTLVRIHYGCSVPPAPTFCPLKSAKAKNGAGFKVPVVAGTSIVLVGYAGPLTTPSPVVHPVSASVVPAYIPTLTVEGVTPVSKNAPKGTRAKVVGPGPTVAVKPGDDVVMITRLVGRPVGASQAVTVKIDQGPGRSVNVSATVAGGQTSTATITSANGRRITLVVPRYSCFMAPTPTFCPVQKLIAANRHYELTFMASPYTPVVLSAIAGAG